MIFPSRTIAENAAKSIKTRAAWNVMRRTSVIKSLNSAAKNANTKPSRSPIWVVTFAPSTHHPSCFLHKAVEWNPRQNTWRNARWNSWRNALHIPQCTSVTWWNFHHHSCFWRLLSNHKVCRMADNSYCLMIWIVFSLNLDIQRRSIKYVWSSGRCIMRLDSELIRF